MSPKKTLQQREKELRSLLATPEGQQELHDLESGYLAATDKLRTPRGSVITYILVHEREQGLIGS